MANVANVANARLHLVGIEVLLGLGCDVKRILVLVLFRHDVWL